MSASVRVRRFTNHLAETNTPYSVARQIDALYGAARLLCPQQDLSWLKKFKARLYALAPCSRTTGPVITSTQLLELGLSLMAQRDPISKLSMTRSDLANYRDGLIIALLSLVPLRHKNLAQLEIGNNCIYSAVGSNQMFGNDSNAPKRQPAVSKRRPARANDSGRRA